MKKSTTWQTKDGRTVEVIVRLDTEREEWADGWDVKVACCDLSVTTTLAGHVVAYSEPMMLDADDPARRAGAVARLGRIGLTQERLDQILALIAEVKAAPEYQALMAREAQNIADAERLDSERRRNGLCPHCGTYCNGDCR